MPFAGTIEELDGNRRTKPRQWLVLLGLVRDERYDSGQAEKARAELMARAWRPAKFRK